MEPDGVASNNWNSWNSNWRQEAIPGGDDRCCNALGCYSGPMRRTLDPFRFLLVTVAGWLGQQQRDAIDYLREENRVLREQLGGDTVKKSKATITSR